MEDTDKATIQKENQPLIEEMLRTAEVAEEPGDIVKNPVIHKGDDEIPSPMVGKVTSAGYVFIYDTRTGERSKANRNMLPNLLTKAKRPDGSLIFTTIKPPFEPPVGTNKCILHKEAPDRKLYDEMGLPVCPASHLSSPYQVKRHMQKRHPAEWAAIEHERETLDKAEDRALRRKMLAGTPIPESILLKKEEKKEEVPMAGTSEAPLYVSSKPPYVSNKPAKVKSKVKNKK